MNKSKKLFAKERKKVFIILNLFGPGRHEDCYHVFLCWSFPTCQHTYFSLFLIPSNFIASFGFDTFTVAILVEPSL